MAEKHTSQDRFGFLQFRQQFFEFLLQHSEFGSALVKLLLQLGVRLLQPGFDKGRMFQIRLEFGDLLESLFQFGGVD